MLDFLYNIFIFGTYFFHIKLHDAINCLFKRGRGFHIFENVKLFIQQEEKLYRLSLDVNRRHDFDFAEDGGLYMTSRTCNYRNNKCCLSLTNATQITYTIMNTLFPVLKSRYTEFHTIIVNLSTGNEPGFGCTEIKTTGDLVFLNIFMQNISSTDQFITVFIHELSHVLTSLLPQTNNHDNEFYNTAASLTCILKCSKLSLFSNVTFYPIAEFGSH